MTIRPLTEEDIKSYGNDNDMHFFIDYKNFKDNSQSIKQHENEIEKLESNISKLTQFVENNARGKQFALFHNKPNLIRTCTHRRIKKKIKLLRKSVKELHIKIEERTFESSEIIKKYGSLKELEEQYNSLKESIVEIKKEVAIFTHYMDDKYPNVPFERDEMAVGDYPDLIVDANYKPSEILLKQHRLVLPMSDNACEEDLQGTFIGNAGNYPRSRGRDYSFKDVPYKSRIDLD